MNHVENQLELAGDKFVYGSVDNSKRPFLPSTNDSVLRLLQSRFPYSTWDLPMASFYATLIAIPDSSHIGWMRSFSTRVPWEDLHDRRHPVPFLGFERR